MAGIKFLDSDISERFLTSDVIALATEHSQRTFKIHKALLESKSIGLFSRLENFKEGAENIYRFHDTSENTVVRFIEWAYRRDYSEAVINVSPASVEEGVAASEGPLNCHMQMYIFAHVYGILGLGATAYVHITSYLKTKGKPADERTKLEVISALKIGFKKIIRTDTLLDWLGHYVSFYLDEMKESDAFQELIEEVPSLSLAMLKHLNSASAPPWPNTSVFASTVPMPNSGMFGSTRPVVERPPFS